MNKCFKGIIHLEGAGGFVGKGLMDWKVHRLCGSGDAVPLVGAGVKCLGAARRAA